MKKSLSVIASLFVALTINTNVNGQIVRGHTPVTICHKGETITIDDDALQAHLNHGDYVGSCKNVDSEAPKVVCKNITVALNEAGSASISASEVDGGSTDNVGITSLTIDNSTFSCTNLGQNIVTLKATDAAGNSATCNATVTVLDNILPTITCPENITIQAERNDCSPIVYWALPSASDNCSYTLLSNHQSGERFNVGTTTVTYTVTDGSNNSSFCSFNITVEPSPLIILDRALAAYPSGHNISCKGKSDGFCSINVDGGCFPYSYTWSTTPVQSGTTTVDYGIRAYNLSAGTYTVIITDANGTSISTTVTLTEPDLLVAEAGNNQVVYYGYTPKACATLSGTATGGAPAYAYGWNSGATSATTTVCPSTTTNYVLTVTDVNGCIATDVVTICAIDVRCTQGGNQITTGTGTKVLICHVTRNGTSTMCVDPTAVADHLGHGDRLGVCGTSTSCITSSSRRTIAIGENSSEINAETTEEPAQQELTEVSNDNFVKIYPNPNSGRFFIQSSNEGSFTIINSLGQVIKTVELNNSNNNTAIIDNLERGTYIVSGNGVIEKIIVLE